MQGFDVKDARAPEGFTIRKGYRKSEIFDLMTTQAKTATFHRELQPICIYSYYVDYVAARSTGKKCCAHFLLENVAPLHQSYIRNGKSVWTDSENCIKCNLRNEISDIYLTGESNVWLQQTIWPKLGATKKITLHN